MAREVKQANFWVSYSDLATGLMIVFMVVMLLMVVRSKLQTAMQQDRVREVVESIEIILNTKSKLAESINKALETEQVQADTVTAQVEIADEALSFEKSLAVLKPEGREFLQGVIPPYVCALWEHDKKDCERADADCSRLDPERPRGVRRILVRGHASMVGTYEGNHQLSAARAETVVLEAHRILDRLADGGPEASGPAASAWTRLPTECRENTEALRRYARERLWAVATGDSEHCTASVNASKDRVWCDDVSDAEQDDVRFQKVTFGLEVTGDDMTGLLLDVVALRREVGGHQEEASAVEAIAADVASACWKDPRSYHGCEKYVEECLEPGDRAEAASLCEGLFSTLQDEPGGSLAAMRDRLCASGDEILRGCGIQP